MLLDDYAPLLLRVLLVALFPFSALDKLVNRQAALRQAGGGALAPVLIAAAIAVETVAPACIVLGWHDRLAAFVLAGFCVVTALLYHRFWRFPDFWRFRTGEGLSHFWDFLKNLGLAGGLGLVMLAPRTLPLHEVLRDPLASTRVAGPQAGSVVPAPAAPSAAPSSSSR